MTTPDRSTILSAISNGRIFSVRFIKRSTGEIRTMVCRTGVRSEGGSLKFNAADKDLLVVWDMQARAFRSIPVDGILEMRVQKVVYTFARPVAVRQFERRQVARSQGRSVAGMPVGRQVRRAAARVEVAS